MEHTGKTEKKRRSAFTLAEFLVVVAITMILAGVSFVAVIRYQSRLKRLEMDQTAKEIFLAAQNQLSLNVPEGALKRIFSQEPDSEEKLGIRCQGKDREDVYVVLYQPQGENRTEEIRNRLLPFGSVDETVRTDGSYLIFYDPEAGTVREVWYSDHYVFVEDDIESTALTEAAADTGRREGFTGANPEFADQRQAVGYYAGDSMTEPDVTPSDRPKTADLELVNDDMLYAKITIPDMLSGKSGDVKLYLEGVSSGAKGWMDVRNTSSSRVKHVIMDHAYYVLLDDVTTDGMQFYNLNTDGAFQMGGSRLVPGEDIRMWLEISSGQGAVSSVSQVREENSIFQGKKTDKVTIGSMRHLENLDYRVSRFHPAADKRTLELSEKADANGNPAFEAVQQKNLDWPSFRNKAAEFHDLFGKGMVNGDRISVCYSRTDGEWEVVTATAEGCYAPVQPQFPLIYSGNAFDVTGLLVQTSPGEDGGMFGTVTQNLSVRNLELKQANITSQRNAGALIGMGDGSGDTEELKILVEHVKIRYPQVLAKGGQNQGVMEMNNAGAVIGSFTGQELTIRGVMAANTYRETMTGKEDTAEKDNLPSVQEALYRIQSSNGNAGGLVGMSSGSVSLSGSMASLYVDAMSYAGGLVGMVQATRVALNPNVAVEACYVGGHTVNGAFLTEPLPGQADFEQTAGRYNIVSRSGLAGGLAAVLPAGSQIAHSYVTASVYASVYGEVEKEEDSTSIANGSENGDDSIANTGDENGIFGKQTETNVPDDRKQAAFVAFYGSLYEESTDQIPGAAASDSQFCYCYSAGKVNGTRVVEYPDALKEDFEPKPEFALQAFPYDKTLGSGKAYPMPTVFQLVKKDPAGTGEQKALPAIVCVHIGDWLVPVEKVTPGPQEDGLKLNNGNRLWADYVIDMPAAGETRYVTFSVEGTDINNKKVTVYYILKIDPEDLYGSIYYVLTDAGKVQEGELYQYGYDNVRKNPEKRFDYVEENGKLKISFYLDNLGVSCGGYQALYENVNTGNKSYMKAGEDIRVGACEGVRVPQDSDGIQSCNSLFESVTKNADGTYTAYIANGRHLENLNFFGKQPNRIIVTRAVQTDNILWQEDDTNTISSKTEAYCKEMERAYGISQVYEETTSYTPANGFCPIDNEELLSYDGGGYTIVKLYIPPSKSSQRGSSLFVKSSHLEISNLSLKDPMMESNAASAALLQQAGSYENGNSDNSYLRVKNVRVYGNDMKVSSGGYAYLGGIVAYANVDELEFDQVSFYGSHALIEKTNGGLAGGGLIGRCEIRKKFTMNQSMFSGYLKGPSLGEGSGGLIGHLVLSDSMQGPDGDAGQITGCYVAGRNQPYTDDSDLNQGISLIGASYIGGLIGRVSGPLTISRTFSTAGVYDSNRGGSGGLIGVYEGNTQMTMEQCYVAANLSRLKDSSGGWHWNAGILIGGSGETSVTFKNCAYLNRTECQGGPVVGSQGSAAQEGVTACTWDDRDSMNTIFRSDTEDIPVTDSYDRTLNGPYPYKLWTTEPDETGNLQKTYRGDWITR